MKRLLVSLIIFTSTTLSLLASPSFTIDAPKQVSVNSKFSITYILKDGEASTSSLKVPQINGCSLIFGPSVASSQSYQIINGKASSSSQHEYTYYYRADKEGEYIIGAASIVVDGKKMTTQPASLTIVASKHSQDNQSNGANSSNQPVDIDDISTQNAGKKVDANDVFIRISTSRSSAYEQEAIECTIKLYTKYSISEFMAITQPTFNGFLVEDLQFQSSINARETYNGQEYQTAVLKKCILFPQKSGNLTIVSGTYDLTVVQYEQVNMGFYVVNQPVTKKIRINSNNATISIQPLPIPQPAGFDGAVGQFTAAVRISTNNFRTNEPATLTYSINGTGNIKYIKDAIIDFPSEFEQYTPNHTVDAEMKGNNVSGSSITEYTFIPKEVGNYTINVPNFVYFDPESKEYKTIELESFDIKVAQGISGLTTNQQYVTSKNTDIRYIKLGEKNLSFENSYTLSKAWYWILYVISISIFIGAILYTNATNKRKANVIGLKISQANKVAKKRLKIANKYMQTKDSEHFYEEMLKALWGYLSDKLSIPASQLLRPNIAQELLDRGAPAEVCDSIINILDECEMARYTPSSCDLQQIESVYTRATEAINDLEKIKLIKK